MLLDIWAKQLDLAFLCNNHTNKGLRGISQLQLLRELIKESCRTCRERAGLVCNLAIAPGCGTAKLSCLPAECRYLQLPQGKSSRISVLQVTVVNGNMLVNLYHD